MKKICVVFVHGFTGGIGTWKNSKGESFSDLLSADREINQSYDFYEFDYYTKIDSFFDSAPVVRLLGLFGLGSKKVKKNQPIRRISELLSTYVRTNLNNYDSVIFIAHSMGGLIVKDYILNHEKGDAPEPVGYLSLAVPHKGSIAGYLMGPFNLNAKELQPLNAYCDALNNAWIDTKESLPKAQYYIALHDECVDEVSALPFTVKKSDKFVVEHDHISICKPSAPNDLVCAQVAIFLKSRAYDSAMSDLATTVFEPESNSYEKEIFVIKMILSDVGEKGIDDAKGSFFHAEIITKAADEKDQKVLKILQTKVLSLYQQSYNEHSSELKANEVFAKVHSLLLEQDSEVLASSVDYINFMHKKGLLHQLANKLTTQVTWSDKVGIQDILAKM
ncbi:TPA: ABC-three component system protein [Providencia alcalifaciens]